MTNDLPYPERGLVLTHFLTVRDVARSRDFYADILGGRVVLEVASVLIRMCWLGDARPFGRVCW
jgi:Glyoxalase/Bleomycin resistance protein/Dioxygenase superfamily